MYDNCEHDAQRRRLFPLPADGEILLAWSQNEPLSVPLAIDIAHLGSPATLHKRLSRLRQMELIDAVSEEGDRRTKYLIPTGKGLRYVEKISQAMHRCQTT